MKKFYEEPMIEIRNYTLPPKDVVMTSFIGEGDGDKGPGLGGDDNNYFD